MNDFMADAQKAYENRDFEEALKLYIKEISERPKNLLAQDRAARCLWMLKRPLDAIDRCKQILKLDPNYAAAYLIIAEVYYDLKDIAKARENMQLAYSISPDNAEVLTTYGSFLLFDKKMDDAVGLLEKSIQIDPSNYAAYNNLAVIYSTKRKRAKVLLCAKEMYKLRPSQKNYL